MLQYCTHGFTFCFVFNVVVVVVEAIAYAINRPWGIFHFYTFFDIKGKYVSYLCVFSQ